MLLLDNQNFVVWQRNYQKMLTSEIQNEFIEKLANMVYKEVKKAELYTIMTDSTSDKNLEDIQGVVAPFFSPDPGQIEKKMLENQGAQQKKSLKS